MVAEQGFQDTKNRLDALELDKGILTRGSEMLQAKAKEVDDWKLAIDDELVKKIAKIDGRQDVKKDQE